MSASRNADAIRNRRAGQQRIRRKCKCGRIFTGNLAWASHRRAHVFTKPHGEHAAGDWLDGHGYNGRA